MFWNRSKSSPPKLKHHQLERLERLPPPKPLIECALDTERFVVVDLETTGLDTRRDEVISIGCVVIEREAIDFGQLFECTLQRDMQRYTESILIHGISPAELAAGIDPADALLDFMEFVGDSPLMAFHAGFDQKMLVRACQETLGYNLQHAFFDIAEMAPMLNTEIGFRHNGLDNWISHFRLQVGQRHHASADALVTAEIALILLSQSRGRIETAAQLEQELSRWRRTRVPGLSL